jgi:acyl-CoA thioester hydrolase
LPLSEKRCSPIVSKVFRKSFEVRWDDVDLNGHLRSTRYLEYASTTRHGYLTTVGWGAPAMMKSGITAVLLAEEVRYLREVFLAQNVEVTCEVVGLSPDASRWRVRHVALREDGKEAAVIRSEGAWIDVRTRKITTPPAGLREFLESTRSEDYELIK